MRVAIPVHNGKLSEYFGQCSYYKIFNVDGKHIQAEEIAIPLVENIEELPAWASEKHITDIITYKVDKRIISLFIRFKINLYVGISIDTPENLLNEFLSERMVSDQKVINEIIER